MLALPAAIIVIFELIDANSLLWTRVRCTLTLALGPRQVSTCRSPILVLSKACDSRLWNGTTVLSTSSGKLMLVAIFIHNLAAFADCIRAIEDICPCQAAQKTITMATEWTPSLWDANDGRMLAGYESAGHVFVTHGFHGQQQSGAHVGQVFIWNRLVVRLFNHLHVSTEVAGRHNIRPRDDNVAHSVVKLVHLCGSHLLNGGLNLVRQRDQQGVLRAVARHGGATTLTNVL